jgi:hypothetical protein
MAGLAHGYSVWNSAGVSLSSATVDFSHGMQQLSDQSTGIPISTELCWPLSAATSSTERENAEGSVTRSVFLRIFTPHRV